MKPTTSRTTLVAALAVLSFGLTLLLLAQDLKLVPPGERLKPGNYYSWQLLVQHPKLSPPPLPGCPFPDLLVYAVDERNFIYDDREVDYAKLRAEAAEKAAAESEGKLDATGQMAMSMESYGTTNLWIEITGGSNAVTLTLHNTTSGTNYAFYSRTNVASGLWTPEAFAAGADGATAVTTPMDGRTNLFFIAGVGDDTDGDGLSDMEERFTQTDPNNPDTGNTGIPDGHKDPDGDGWSNLDEVRNGTDPFSWNTPPAPPAFQARLDATGTNVVLTWQPAGGSVQEYVLIKWGTVIGGTEIGHFAPGTLSALDSPADNYSYPNYSVIYEVHAVYGGGGVSAPAFASVPASGPAVNAQVVRGQANYGVVLSAPPPETIGVRIIWEHYNNQTYSYEYPFLDVPLPEFTNGIAVLPNDLWQPLNDKRLWLQGLGTNGQVGPLVYCGWIEDRTALRPSDLGAPLRDNLRFLVRAATVTQQFRYYSYYTIPVTVSYLDRAPVSPDYEEAGLWYYDPSDGSLHFNPGRALEENRVWRNFLFATNEFDSNGNFLTGADDHYITHIRYIQNPKYRWTNWLANPEPPGSVLGSTEARWIFARRDTLSTAGDPDVLAEMGLAMVGEHRLVLAGGARNYYGLPFTSAQIVTSQSGTGRFYMVLPSDLGNLDARNARKYFLDIEAPQLETLGYYFVHLQALHNYGTSLPPVPGMANFSTTNTTPLILASAGQPIILAGYAVQRLANGDTNIPLYVGQQFDGAFTADPATGLATTNVAGVVSEFGEFLPTQPGLVAVVTKPDPDQGGIQGTALVHVIKLQLDVNHDGVMDLSFAGPDNTSAQRPFLFWINNDCDWATYPGSPYFDPGADKDLAARYPGYADYTESRPRSIRDLEDWGRLWICGVPALANQNYSVTLNWGNVSGTPAINLIRSADTNGGMLYLTDTNVHSLDGTAWKQVSSESGVTIRVPTTGAVTLPSNWFTNGVNKYLLFEGAGIGSGQLLLTIRVDGTNLAQATAWLDLHDIKDFYEMARATNVTSGIPPSSLVSQLQMVRATAAPQDETRQIIVFVHGINNTEYQAANNAETMFKRLYWSGYHGRFAAFRWPCAYLPNEGSINPIEYLKAFNFNKGEFYAWKSAAALRDYLTGLRTRFPTYTLNVFAHSQGAVVFSEAVLQGAPFDNCILTQGAIPASCYDPSAPTLSKLLTAEHQPNGATPEYTPIGYRSCFTNISGNVVNFFNTNDYALAKAPSGPRLLET